MNQLPATLKSIEQIESLHKLTFEVGSATVTLLSLEIDNSLRIGSDVQLSIKSTDIALAKNFSGQLSYANQLRGVITELRNGELLSSIDVQIEGFSLQSIITLTSSLEMALQKGDEVTVLFKGSEVSVCE